LAGPIEASRAFSSAAVFFRSMLSLLYDSVMSSSWFDAVSICFLRSLAAGAGLGISHRDEAEPVLDPVAEPGRQLEDINVTA
jgi:hypothetical protein